MKRSIWLLACTCVIGLGVVVPALAGAGGNPQWSVAGSQLGLGETLSVTGTASGLQKFKSGETTIACTSLALASGSIVTGGNGATPGTGSEQIVYGGCVVENTTTEEVAAGCKVNSVGESVGNLKTEKLAAKLAYTGIAVAEKEEPSTVTALKPESGSVYLRVELSGEHCPTPGNGKYTVEGEVALKNPEGAVEKTGHIAEGPATPVKIYYLNNGGVPEEHKVKGLKLGTTNAAYYGNSTITTSPEANWSAIH